MNRAHTVPSPTPLMTTCLPARTHRVDAVIDRLKETATAEAYLQAGHDLQRYVTENRLYQSVTTLPFLQAARTSVRGYENLHGHKIRFETTWLDKP
jgi:hypothetical protein